MPPVPHIPHMQIPPLGLPPFLPPEMQRMGVPRPLRNITNKAEQLQSIPGMMLSSNKVRIWLSTRSKIANLSNYSETSLNRTLRKPALPEYRAIILSPRQTILCI
jgi:hypothetical protein